MSDRFSIHALERDLGQAAAARVLANIGGQTRNVPLPHNAPRSALAREVGETAARWLADHFGGEKVRFPSRRGREVDDRSAALIADILDAGLIEPTVSANTLATRHGVTDDWVTRLRGRLLREQRQPDRPDDGDVSDLPLFRKNG